MATITNAAVISAAILTEVVYMCASAASVLLLTKQDPTDTRQERAINFVQHHFSRVTVMQGQWGDPMPPEAMDWQGDFVLSYLSRWIVPKKLLNRVKRAALNFHPAPPDYPGIGCNNFALYNDEATFGVTCHHMQASVDTGKIISIKRFPVFPSDDVCSLLERTHDHLITLFFEIVSLLVDDAPLPTTNETWRRAPYTRRDLNELCELSVDMSKEEFDRRIRATAYRQWQPMVTIHGHRFQRID